MSKLHSSIILTYRCNARCNMCEVWKHPSSPQDEIGIDAIRKLPYTVFTNITGGEPFVRQDLPEIVDILKKKTKRIVISTNGYFTDRIISLCEKHPDIGIRISIEGLKETNDAIRDIPDGFDRGMKTLLKLKDMGLKDIGVAMTVQEMNCCDLLPLYEIAKGLNYEFATATIHNSHYFHKWDNKIKEPGHVCSKLKKLARKQLGSSHPKEWFRAYFNWGLINYINGKDRPIKCGMGKDAFFVDPYGDVLACNGMDEKKPMGNLNHQSWDEIWNSPQAKQVRQSVANCTKNCWMIGSAAPAMKGNIRIPAMWVIRKKLALMFGKDIM